MLDRPILFIATANPDESRTFYTDVLGFSFVADEGFALVFDAGGSPLRIQKVEAHNPAPHTVLGWMVDEIHSAVSYLTDRGVRFEFFDELPQDARGIWEIPGTVRVAWFKDPDGNMLSLTQHLAEG